MNIAAFADEPNKLGVRFQEYKTAAWDVDGQILGGWFEDKYNNVGTWCGFSKNGRVSFLVETASTNFKISSVNHSEIFPVEFLKSTLSPKQFANFVAKMEEDLKDNGKGLVYDLIVADITSKSMFHIGKDSPKDSHVEITEVANVFSEFSADDFPGETNNNEMDHYGATSTAALVVKDNGEVMFYERYLEDGEWKDHNFTFNM